MPRNNDKNPGHLRRNFRQLIDADVRLGELEKALRRTTEMNERWDTIRAATKEFGFFGVRMHIDGAVFEDFSAKTDGACWQLRLALAESQYINFFRSCDSDMNSVLLSAFMNAIERGFRNEPIEAPAKPDFQPSFAFANLFRALFRWRRAPGAAQSIEA